MAKIDKSVLTFGMETPIKDEKYRKSFRGARCWGCGVQDDTVVGMHIRFGRHGYGKPSDDLIIPGCARCHDAFDGRDPCQPSGADFVLERIVKPAAKRRYDRFLRETGDGRSSDAFTGNLYLIDGN